MAVTVFYVAWTVLHVPHSRRPARRARRPARTRSLEACEEREREHLGQKAKARIWPCLSNMRHVRVDLHEESAAPPRDLIWGSALERIWHE